MLCEHPECSYVPALLDMAYIAKRSCVVKGVE